MLYDVEKISNKNIFNYDVIIIGAGASGIICGNKINKINPKLRIAIIESGGLRNNEKINSLDTDYELDNKIDFKRSCARYLGGKTNLWSGRLVNIDNLELTKWPIKKKEIEFWRNEAMGILALGYSMEKLERVCQKLIKGRFYKKLLGNNFNISPSLITNLKAFKLNYKNNKNLDLFIKANAVKLNKESKINKISHLDVISSITKKKFTFKANYIICCNGGLEVVKLLLHSGKDKSIGLANSSGKLGLNFSAHPRGLEGIIKLKNRINIYKTFLCSRKNINNKLKIEFGIELSNNKVKENNIGKSRICFDPIIAEYHSKFFYKFKKSNKLKRGLLNKLGIQEKGFIIGLFSFLKIKLKQVFRLPIYTRYLAIRNYCASSLNENSKVYLSKDKDFHGYEKLNIDWQISEKDKNSLVLSHKYLSKNISLKKIGFLKSTINDGSDWKIWNGSSHFMSTTVMSESKTQGVVNTDCRTHDLDNLFICGPSIFPTPSSSNPMLFTTLLSLRLANHIVKLFKD